MFLACPHCGYLVALIVAKDGPTRTCPRCHGALPSEAVDAAGASASASATSKEASARDAEAARADDARGATSGASTIGSNADSSDISNAAPAPVRNETAHAPIANNELRKAGTVAASLRLSESGAGEAKLSEPKAVAARHGEPATHAATAAIDHAEPAAGDTALTPDALQTPDTESAESTANEVSEPSPPPANISEPAPLPPLSAATPALAASKRRGAARARNGKSETAVSSGRRAPSFARQQARARAAAPRLHWSGPVLIAALALTLALQLLLAQRGELAADARWRPLVASLCGVLPCEIPPWREPAALTMLNRNVLPVADRAGALRVSAGFRNDARWPQPWPTLVLSLEDVDGRRVGQRAFSPKDYRKGYRTGELIAPGQSAAVQFDVLEPAPHVVAFTFDFR